MWRSFIGTIVFAAALGAFQAEAAAPNLVWAAGAAIAYENTNQPLTPILLSFAAHYSAGNPGLPPETVIEKTQELKRYIEERNLPQRIEDIAALWDSAGKGMIGQGIRYFHRNYLSDSTNEVWNSMKGFARELAAGPGFWTEIEQLASADPDRTGRAVAALSSTYLGIDRTMPAQQIKARVPGFEAAERFERLLDGAAQGRLTAQQVMDAIAELRRSWGRNSKRSPDKCG
jgi:hypothetical protein